MKKGIEISMNTIIIAAIALIVLLILVLIMTGQTGKFTRGIKDCESRGGDSSECTKTSADCVSRGGIPSGECIFYTADGKEDLGKTYKDFVCCVYKK